MNGKMIEGGKQPYAIARANGEPLALLGIWESWRGEAARSSALLRSITTQPNAEMVPQHNGMPVVVDPKDWPAWLGEVEADPRHAARSST